MQLTSQSDGRYFQFFVASVANLMAITDGMTMGWTSPMIPYFLSDKTHITMTRNEVELMESCLLLGAVGGLPITAFCVTKIGRKKSLLLGTSVVILCWILIVVAKSVEVIYVSRVLNGLGLNMAFVAAPMYVGEIAQKEFRGFLSSNVFVMSLLGIVLIYCIGPFVPFYVPSAIAIPILIIELIIFSMMPESPYYLILKNKHEEARKSLQKFRGGRDVEDELKAIKQGIDLENKEKGLKFKDIFIMKNYKKSMIIMLVVNSAQLFCANDVIVMNLHEILIEAGSIYMKSEMAAILFAVINLIASIIASLLMDKFGRKMLLIVSLVFTGLCLLVIAIYFNLKNAGYDTISYSWIPIATVMVYSAGYKVGLGMVPIVLTAEVFAPKLKVLGMTFADGVYVVSSLLALQVFFELKNIFGIHVPFYIFFCYAILTCLFVIFYLPETKGKSLDEIQEMLRGNKISSRRQSENYKTEDNVNNF